MRPANFDVHELIAAGGVKFVNVLKMKKHAKIATMIMAMNNLDS